MLREFVGNPLLRSPTNCIVQGNNMIGQEAIMKWLRLNRK